MIINLLMGADARGTRGQQEMTPLHSLLGLDVTFYLGFFLGLRFVYCIALRLYFTGYLLLLLGCRHCSEF